MAELLYDKYKTQINEIIGKIKDEKAKALPSIITEITTEIVPSMMVDIGKVKNLTGKEKKQLIIDTIQLAITEAFKELNKIPELANESWDEELRDLLVTLITPTIDLLIKVENGSLKFNPKIKQFFCCFN